MDPEAIQRWGDANRAYLALENEVAAIFAPELTARGIPTKPGTP